MSKSAIYAVNTVTGASLTDGATYSPNTIIRRYGSSCQLVNNAITLSGAGYYDVNAIATVTATAVGNIVGTLYIDGVEVPGATATVTASAIGDEVTLPISALVRLKCNCSTSVVTVVISGQATTAVNLAINVEKR